MWHGCTWLNTAEASSPWDGRFYGNTGQAGGGLFQDAVEGAVDQCAFEDNVATNSGGGLSQAGGTGNVTNCIFINNAVRRRTPLRILRYFRSCSLS